MSIPFYKLPAHLLSQIEKIEKEITELKEALHQLQLDVEEKCADNEWTIEEEEDETITELQESVIDLKEKFNNIPPLYRGDYDVR